MPRLISQVMLASVIVLIASATAAGASAQDAATPVPSSPGALVNGVSVCPDGLAGDAIDPAACTEPAAGVEFYAANPNTDNVAFGATKGDGLVSFPLDQFAISPEGAPVDLGLIADSNPYGPVTGYLVTCTVNGEPLDFSYQSGDVQPGGATLGIQFSVVEGDQVACEWYLSHAVDDDDTPPVTSLPSTGTGGAMEYVDGALVGGLTLVALGGGGVALAVARRERSIQQ